MSGRVRHNRQGRLTIFRVIQYNYSVSKLVSFITYFVNNHYTLPATGVFDTQVGFFHVACIQLHANLVNQANINMTLASLLTLIFTTETNKYEAHFQYRQTDRTAVC